MKSLYLLVLMFISVTCFSQTADFTYTTSTGTFCAPQVVTFTQNSSGNPVSFVWRFGNGKVGNQSTERIAYNNPGTYTVRLIAVYDDVAVTTEKTIVINPRPTVSLQADRSLHCKPGSITFTAGSTGNVSDYIWDFGDGSSLQTTSNNVVAHEFTSWGTFNVTVTARSSQGCSESANTSVEFRPLSLTASMDLTSGCVPARPRFRINTQFLPEDGLQNVLWNFGDGTEAENGVSNNIVHTYTSTEKITDASVTVTSIQGCRAEFNFSEFGFGAPPTDLRIATTSGRDTFCGSEHVEFSGLANGAEFYTWYYGDGSTDSLESTVLEHRYRQLGDKEVIVTPYQNGCAGLSDTINIHIEGVVAKFDVRNTCSALNSYTFPNRSEGNIDHIQWIYSNIPGSPDRVSFHGAQTFPVSGSYYTELLLVDDITGCRDSLKRDIYTAQPLFVSDKNSVCKDSMIRYRVENDYDPASGFNYIFNVNGSIVDNGTVNHLSYFPTAHGLYDDFLVIKDNYPGTCNDTVRLSEPVRVKGPVADFFMPEQICYDSAITVQNNSYPYYDYEPITKWQWSYGEEFTDNAQNPQPYAFESPGAHLVTLTATDVNNCVQKITQPVRIHRLPRVDVLPRMDTLCQGSTAELIAYSSDTIFWEPLYGINCLGCDTIQVRPVHSTNYIAIAQNPFGCKNYDSSIVKVYEPINLAAFPADTAVCFGNSVQYNLNADGITTWDPPTFLNNANIKNPVSLPASDIEYKIVVKDSVGCFSDSAFSRIKVNPLPVVEAGEDIVQDYNTRYTITPTYGSGITSYLWTTQANASCLTCPNPTGILESSQLFKIEVTDLNGCKSSDEVKVIINCSTSTLWVPNAFTPNRDGLNDYFYPISRGFEIIRSFMVFDRSGLKVFERQNFRPNNPTDGWDGSFKGSNHFNTQNFVWIAQVECDGKLITKKGTILMIK